MFSQEFDISSMRMFTLSNHMLTNSDTLASLQILRSELHPNSQAWGPEVASKSAKESLSVYGLFHQYACSPQGKLRLRQIFLRPSTDISLIRQRQHAISVLLRPENVDILSSLSRSLRKIQNIRRNVDDLQKGTDAGPRKAATDRSVWSTLQRFSAHCIQIRECLTRLETKEKVDIVDQVLSKIHASDIRAVGQLVSQTIDFEESELRARVAVASGIDAHLDELKCTYDGMEALLFRVAGELNEELPEWARRYVRSCNFLPQLGFLTVVELDSNTGRGKYDGEGLIDDIWEMMFAAEDGAYYKNARMRELDNHVGDLYCSIAGTYSHRHGRRESTLDMHD